MMLSDFERRALADIELSLERDSPRLARLLAYNNPRREHPPRRMVTAAGIGLTTVGVAVMLVGLLADQDGSSVVVLAGYVMLVLGTCAAMLGWFRLRVCEQL